MRTQPRLPNLKETTMHTSFSELGLGSEIVSALAEQGYQSPRLLWYLDYCCRDDYGQGIDQVSAYAGLHYFAARGNEHAPVLTWADGLNHLSEALRAHATQIDPAGTFFGTPAAVQPTMWPTEEFELAKARVKTTFPETDLLAGLE